MFSKMKDQEGHPVVRDYSGSNTHVSFTSIDLSDHLASCMCAACAQNETFLDDTARALAQTPNSTGQTSAAATASLQDMADFLETGYWNNETGLRHNLGTSGLDPNDGVLYYNLSGFNALRYSDFSDANGVTNSRADLIRDAFDVYSAVLGIEFVETTSTDDAVVDFFFTDNESGAYASSLRYGDGSIYYSVVNVAQNWSGGTSTYDDYTLQTIFHEIGHALGLGHQGPYNGGGTYANDAVFELDSWQASMMSYFSQGENTAVSANTEFLQTPMAVDWLALDSIYSQFGYGVSNAFQGDTTYGFNTNITENKSAIWNSFSDFASRTASTIVDGSGSDTLDVSGYGANQKIDLTIQTADQTFQNTSNIGGRTGNLTLAVGTVIENAVGGSGNDEIIGNSADNVLKGGGGNDRFSGKGGNDTFDGGGGFDTVLFSSAFESYALSVISTAIQVVGEGIDLVLDTIENIQFSDTSYSFTSLLELFGNGAPVAQDDAASVTEGVALTLDVLENDSDPESELLTITQVDGKDISEGQTVTLASGAKVTLNSNGTLDYDQDDAFFDLRNGDTVVERFVYKVEDTSGGVSQAEVAITIEGMDPVSTSSSAIGQSGTVKMRQENSDQWFSVSFDTEIENAVVIMGPISFNGAQAATTRIRNVTDTGFEFQLDEWDYLDGRHTTESIGWLAVSEGSHTLSNGQTIVAGTQSVGTSFEKVNFGENLSDAVVLSEVTTVNESDALTTRMRRVDSNGFEVKLQEEEAGGSHIDETVSWIAIETGATPNLDVFRSGDQVNQSADTFVFNADFESAPVLLADMQSTDGGDLATVRMRDVGRNSVSLFIEEEQSRDTEVRHTNETIGYVALENGLIFDELALA